MTRWYRAYEGTVTDAKLHEAAVVAGVSRSVAIATWHALLEACASARGGQYDTSPRRIAVILGEPMAAIEGLFAALTELDLLADGQVVAWARRQFESDSSTERSRKHRETRRNADATLQGRRATPPETEADTEEVGGGRESEPAVTVVAAPAPSPASLSPAIAIRKALCAAFEEAGRLPPAMHDVTVWVERGYDPEMVIGICRAGIARGASTLSYFSAQLDREHARIAAERARPPPTVVDHQPAVVSLQSPYRGNRNGRPSVQDVALQALELADGRDAAPDRRDDDLVLVASPGLPH
ncbi:hypothetical protein ACJ4V0_15860 [Phreatobacter sp. HK31-P]